MHGIEINDLRLETIHSKECRVPAGRLLSQHRHYFDHVSILAQGSVELRWRNNTEEAWQSRFITGPQHLIIKAGVYHEIRAVSGVVWYCIHTPGPDANVNDFEG